MHMPLGDWWHGTQRLAYPKAADRMEERGCGAACCRGGRGTDISNDERRQLVRRKGAADKDGRAVPYAGYAMGRLDQGPLGHLHSDQNSTVSNPGLVTPVANGCPVKTTAIPRDLTHDQGVTRPRNDVPKERKTTGILRVHVPEH